MKKKYFYYSDEDGDKIVFTRVEGTPVTVEGYEDVALFCFKLDGGYYVNEVTTGATVAEGHNRESAIKNAKDALSSRTPEEVRLAVEELRAQGFVSPVARDLLFGKLEEKVVVPKKRDASTGISAEVRDGGE